MTTLSSSGYCQLFNGAPTNTSTGIHPYSVIYTKPQHTQPTPVVAPAPTPHVDTYQEKMASIQHQNELNAAKATLNEQQIQLAKQELQKIALNKQIAAMKVLILL